MSEYLRDEFPDIDVYSGIDDNSILDRVRDIRTTGPGTFEASHIYDEEMYMMMYE